MGDPVSRGQKIDPPTPEQWVGRPPGRPSARVAGPSGTGTLNCRPPQPPVMTGRRGPRLYLASGLLLGLGYLLYAVAVADHWFGINYQVYYVAAEAAVAGRDFYGVAPARVPEYTYLYPPLTVVAFLPSALAASWVPGYLVHTAGTVAVAIALTAAVRTLAAEHGATLGRVDAVLVFGFVLGSAHAMPSVVYGQVNHHVALGVAASVLWLERDREYLAGAALAGAAFLKTFPALLGAWFLRRRAWRAVAAAAGTGLLLVGLSVAAFGVETNLYYLTEVLLGRADRAAFEGGLPPTADFLTLWRPLSVAFPDGPAWLWGLVAVGLLAVPVGYLYTAVDTGVGRLAAATGTLVAVLLALPSYPVYYPLLFGPLIPLLYVLGPGRPRRVVLAGALLSNLTLRYGDFATAVGAAPLETSTAEALLSVARPVFTVGSPTLYGLLVVLVGCVLVARENGATGPD